MPLHAVKQNGVFRDHVPATPEPPTNYASLDRNEHFGGLHLQSTAKICRCCIFTSRTGHKIEVSFVVHPPPLPRRPGELTTLPVINNGSLRDGKHANGTDLITLDPFAAHAASLTVEEDPFGDFQKLFTSPDRSASQSNQKLDEAIQKVDRRINDMKASRKINYFSCLLSHHAVCNIQRHYSNSILVSFFAAGRFWSRHRV